MSYFSQHFEILADPRNRLTDGQMRGQFDFIQSVNTKVSEAHQAIIQMRELKSQMKSYSQRFEETDTLKLRLMELDSLLTTIVETLYQVKNKSNQDPLNFPIKLTNKLAHLNSLVQISDDPPTDQMISVRDELSAAIDVQLDRYRQILDVHIPEVNAMIRERAVDALWIKD